MKNKKLGLGLVGIFLLVFFSNISNISITNNSPEISQGATPDKLIPVDFPIYIDGNWSETADLYNWVTGSGIEEDPYIIENIYVTNENQTAYISIKKAEHFIIRNCIIFNYSAPYGHYTFAGIYIEKGEYGLIDNITIINCSIGISFYEAKDDVKITNNKFIGSHDDNKTGWGAAIRIQEAKNVEIFNNDIYNFYDGIIVRDAEEVYIENNRIETNFGHISDTGIYFYGVNDSAIIDNDFYGCTFAGHEFEEPKTSSNGDDNYLITLDSCHNIEIHGNRYFESSLIDDPNNPNDSNTPNHWAFGVILIVGFAIIIRYLFWIYIQYKKRVKNDKENEIIHEGLEKGD